MKVKDVVAAKVVSDKKKSDFQWREWADLAERTQEMYRRASVSQKFAKISLGDGKRPVCLLPFSDQHIGSRGMSYSIFRKMTDEILATPDLYIAIMGDLAEFAIKLRSVAEVCAQIFSPEKQMQFVSDWFEEVKPKVAFCTWGNHEDERTEKQAGFGAMKWLMGKEAVYFDGIGHADIGVCKQVYRWAVTHKFRGYSYQNPCHAGMRYMRFQGVDREIAWMGDIHQPAFICYYDGPLERCSGVAGTLNINSLYAGRYFSIFTQPQFPCVQMSHDTHEWDAFRNLGAWKRLTGGGSVKRSHSQLKRWFDDCNRRWFDSRLPSDTHVFYAPDDKNHGIAVDFPNGLKFIKIDTSVAGTRYAKMTLLHEMNHLDTGDFGHGKRFQEGMIRLAKAGAFRAVW